MITYTHDYTAIRQEEPQDRHVSALLHSELEEVIDAVFHENLLKFCNKITPITFNGDRHTCATGMKHCTNNNAYCDLKRNDID